MSRPSTPPLDLPGGGQRITVHRCCNGCGRDLGDATDNEVTVAVLGHDLPDATRECGCVDRALLLIAVAQIADDGASASDKTEQLGHTAMVAARTVSVLIDQGLADVESYDAHWDVAIETALRSIGGNPGLVAVARCGDRHKPVQHRDGRGAWCKACLHNSAGVHRDDMSRPGARRTGGDR